MPQELLVETWTYDRMTEELPVESRYELRNFELLDMSSPNPTHQDIIGNLNEAMRSFVKKNKLGKVYFAPFDVIFNKGNVCQPDILFVSNENLHKITKRGFEGMGIDLLVEVVSPSSYFRDNVEKKEDYEKFGVKEFWIIDPAQKVVEIFSLQNNVYKLHDFKAENGKVTSVILKGFEVDLTEIFE